MRAEIEKVEDLFDPAMDCQMTFSRLIIEKTQREAASVQFG